MTEKALIDPSDKLFKAQRNARQQVAAGGGGIKRDRAPTSSVAQGNANAKAKAKIAPMKPAVPDTGGVFKRVVEKDPLDDSDSD